MHKKRIYPLWFLLPALILFAALFLIPTVSSFYFSMTIWDLIDYTFCGFQNFKMFFSEPSLSIAFRNTLWYAGSTCLLKSIGAFFIAVFLNMKLKTKTLLRSIVFFPELISNVAIGIAFYAILHPTKGMLNDFLSILNNNPVKIGWLTDTQLAMWSCIAVDVWKGLGTSVVIYLAGIQSIDRGMFEAADIDGASSWQKLRYITIPLCASATNLNIILSFIGGLRSFDLIWCLTSGGPGYATDVFASTIYKQYAAGYYGLSTAGNVIMLVFISVMIFPLNHFLNKREERAVG